MATKTYEIKHSYASGIGGPWKKGDRVQLDQDVADAIRKDSPGVIAKGKGQATSGKDANSPSAVLAKQLKGMTVVQLQHRAHQVGVKESGKKGDLIKRIVKKETGKAAPAAKPAAKKVKAEDITEAKLKGMKMPSLWALAKQLEVSAKGKKPELIARILDAQKKS